MEGNTCLSCHQPFERRKKGFKRTSLSKLGIPLIKIKDILDKKIKIPFTPAEKVFLCTGCASMTVKIYKHSETTLRNGKHSKTPDVQREKKRKRTVLTPLKWVKRKCLTSTPKHGETSRPSYLQKHGFKDKVVQNLKISKI